MVDPPEGYNAFVKARNPIKTVEDRLCWSLVEKDCSPYEIGIFAGESQVFPPFNIYDNCILVACENGWLSKDIRVALQRRRYRGTLKIVSDSTNAVEYAFILDPDHFNQQLKLTRLNSRRNTSKHL